MRFKLVATTSIPVQQQLQWILFSHQSSGFITGDERKAFALPLTNPGQVMPLEPARSFDPDANMQHPYNLPISHDVYEEFAEQGWHGFRFLEQGACDHSKGKDGKPVGDLLRTLVFGPDYGHYVQHPASKMILSLRSGSMELLKRTADGFASVDQTRTRGKAALAFAGHPMESLIVYGDNGGTFHAHRFDDAGFGKASKIAAKERNASRVEFVMGGKMLVVGGMGYLSTFKYEGGKFSQSHDVSIAVRDFLWLGEGNLVLVNQGLHGVSAYAFGEGGFTKLGEVKPAGGAQQMVVSRDSKYQAVTSQESAAVSMYELF